MIDLGNLAAIFAAFFLFIISPGPATLGISSISAALGRKTGIMFAIGLSIGSMFWGVVAATGLGAMLQAATHFLSLLETVGGIYLLWLARASFIAAMKSRKVIRVSEKPPPVGNGPIIVRGIVLNLSNPETAVGWIASLSMGIGAHDGALSVVVATSGCALIGLLTYSAYAVAFSHSAVMRGYSRFRPWVESCVGALFALAGFGLILSAFANI